MHAKEGFSYEDCEETAQWLLGNIKQQPEVAIICGSGLGMLAESLEEQQAFAYEDIPNFPTSTVPGHAGELVFGELNGKFCVCMKGRFHLYEGYPPWKVTFPIRVFKLMGVCVLFVTNAAGGLADDYSPGDIMIIRNQINIPGMGGMNPLVGPNDERFGPRFPPLSDPFDEELRTAAQEISKRLGCSEILREGVYCMVSGPNFESVAEARFLHTIGADAVGMSTAVEVLVAKHCGMRVFGISLITNRVAKDYGGKEEVNHEEVLKIGSERAVTLQTLITELVGTLDPNNNMISEENDMCN